MKKSTENKVCHLKKALYELKQAPRAWYNHIDGYFMKNGFKKCPCEDTLLQGDQDNFLMIFLYVDDLIFTGNSTSMHNEFKRNLIYEFNLTNMALLHFFLRIEIKQQEDGIFISQKKYANDILKRFKMKSATPLHSDGGWFETSQI